MTRDCRRLRSIMDSDKIFQRICRQAQQDKAIARHVERHWGDMDCPKLCVVQPARRDEFHVVHPPDPKTDLRPLSGLVAAAPLGIGEQVGCSSIGASIVGVKLQKSETLTDWSHRPPSSAQISYAPDDVRRLFLVRDERLRILQEKARMPWLRSTP